MRNSIATLVLLTFLPSWVLAEPDWQAITTEAAQLLSDYVRIDTTNPPGNELPAAEFLRAKLAAAGVESVLYPSAPNRANLLARFKGTGKGKPILLLHHMDVVPAQAEDWSFAPFSGAIRDGFVYGRGTLDDKSHGVTHLMALLTRQREGKTCGRDLIFLAVADEEVGGELGAAFMVRNHLEEVRAEAVWNEGGASVEGILPGRAISSIAVTEKNSLWLTLKVHGEGGHGSAPTPDGGINILIAALTRIDAWETPLHLTVSAREALGRLGSAAFPGAGILARNLDVAPISWLARRWVRSNRVLNGTVRNTISLTGLRAGLKHNVIPANAEADLDVRLLPDQRPEDFLAALARQIDDPRVHVEPVRGLPVLQSPESPDNPFFVALEQAIAKRISTSLAIPGLLTGSSDCESFRSVGIPCFGYQPLLGTQDMIARIHGIDERLSLDNLRLGVQVTYDTLDTLCQ